MNTNYIRHRITELRLMRNLSEYKLSSELGHSKGYVQRISSGNSLPSLESLLEICDYFDITPAEFFNEHIPEHPYIRRILYALPHLSEHDLEIILVLVEQFMKDITM